jgi:hypothetical protein
MSTTNLTATSQLRGHNAVFGTLQLRQREPTTAFCDLDEFVSERMARFITGWHAQAVPDRFRSGGQLSRKLWAYRIIRRKLRAW